MATLSATEEWQCYLVTYSVMWRASARNLYLASAASAASRRRLAAGYRLAGWRLARLHHTGGAAAGARRRRRRHRRLWRVINGWRMALRRAGGWPPGGARRQRNGGKCRKAVTKYQAIASLAAKKAWRRYLEKNRRGEKAKISWRINENRRRVSKRRKHLPGGIAGAWRDGAQRIQHQSDKTRQCQLANVKAAKSEETQWRSVTVAGWRHQSIEKTSIWPTSIL